MSNKVCVIVTDCEVCSGLSKADSEKMIHALRHDSRIAHVMTVKAPCVKEARKELRGLSVEGCDRAVIGIWCPPEQFGSVSWLPKKISPSLMDVVDLSILSAKGATGASQIDGIVKALRGSAARIAQAELLKDRKLAFASEAVAVIGSNDRAVSSAKAIAAHGIPTKLIAAQTVSGSKTENLEIIDGSVPESLGGIPGNFKIGYIRNRQKQETDAAVILLVSERCMTTVNAPKDSKITVIPLEQFSDYARRGGKTGGMVFLDDLSSLTPTSDPVIPSWHMLLESAKMAATNKLADNIAVLARDVKAPGLMELVWKEAAEAGVKFIRYDDKTRPKINKGDSTISVKDLVLGESLDIQADVIVTPVTTRPWEPIFIERMYLPSDWDFRLRTRGPQRGTAQSSCDGVFLLGYAGFNMLCDLSEPETDSAISQVVTLMRRGYHIAKGAVAIIEEEKCSACLTCVRTCPYRAAFMNDSWKAEINADKCAGCGNCVAVCPSLAIELKNCTRPQIKDQVSASVEASL